jgi:transketolase
MTTDLDRTTDLDQLSIDTIRTLSMDAVQQANSGHPGLPMGWRPSPTSSSRG